MASTPIWKHPVNWSSPWEEEIAFLTEIITSRDGSEQRIAQRINPRISHRWKSWARGRDLAAVDSRFARDQAAEIAFIHPFAASDESFRPQRQRRPSATPPSRFRRPASRPGSPSGAGRPHGANWDWPRSSRSRATRSARSTTLAEPLENTFPAAGTIMSARRCSGASRGTRRSWRSPTGSAVSTWT